VQTTRLAMSFELLTWSTVLAGPEKFLCKATCNQVFFFSKIPESGWTSKC